MFCCAQTYRKQLRILPYFIRPLSGRKLDGTFDKSIRQHDVRLLIFSLSGRIRLRKDRNAFRDLPACSETYTFTRNRFLLSSNINSCYSNPKRSYRANVISEFIFRHYMKFREMIYYLKSCNSSYTSKRRGGDFS